MPTDFCTLATLLPWIEAALTAALTPIRLEVIDESHKHAGHAGAIPGQVTHVKVRIAAPSLAGQGRVAAHRAVNTALAPAFAAGLHALAIELLPA